MPTSQTTTTTAPRGAWPCLAGTIPVLDDPGITHHARPAQDHSARSAWHRSHRHHHGKHPCRPRLTETTPTAQPPSRRTDVPFPSAPSIKDYVNNSAIPGTASPVSASQPHVWVAHIDSDEYITINPSWFVKHNHGDGGQRTFSASTMSDDGVPSVSVPIDRRDQKVMTRSWRLRERRSCGS
jgi:hypothetical protein